jgi:phage/plasmid-like protein (TIGR03299 family)
LDWEVVKEQLISPFDKELIPAWGIFREDTKHFIGTVGSGYEPIQNKYAFDFVDAILEVENGAHYVTAGALGEGEKIWCLAKVNGQMRIGKTDDVSDTYLLFTTSHDGSLSAQSKITTTRVVCQNTLNIALRGAGASMKVKHTRNAQDRLEAAKALMKGVNVQIKDIEAKFNELAVRKVTKESFVDVMTKLFGNWTENERAKNKVLEVAGLFESNDKNEIPEIRGSAYNLLNAVTEYTDHYSSYRQTEKRMSLTEDQIRAENAFFGGGDKLKTQALEVIMEATNGAQRQELVKVYSQVPENMPSLLDSIIHATVNQ